MEQYYHNLVFHLPEIVYQLDTFGKIIYINDSVRKLGYSPLELKGESLDLLIAEEDREAVDRIIFLKKDEKKLLKSPPRFINERRTGDRITKNLQVRLKSKDHAAGTPYRLGEVVATGIHYIGPDGKKQYSGTIGIIRDAHDELRHTEQLGRLEKYYRLLIENTIEIITLLAHDGTILYTSDSAQRQLGFSPLELIGENIFSMIHGDDQKLFEGLLHDLPGAPGPSRRLESQFRCKNGAWRYYESTITGIRESRDSSPACFVLHSVDVTQKREMEAYAEKRERIYRLILRTSPDAILLFDREGDIIMANDRAALLAGQTRDELIGIHYLAFLSPHEREQALLAKERIESAGIVNDLLFDLVRLDGTHVPLEASLSSIRDREGTIEGYLAILRDISQRKKAEEQRLRLEEELLRIITGRLSNREIELLHFIHDGYEWPKRKREIAKLMDVLPGTLDQFVSRVRKKMENEELDKIVRIASLRFNWK